MRVISASVRGLWSIHGPDGIFVFCQDSSLPRGLLFQLLLIEHSGVGLSLASRFSLALGHTLVCKTRFVFCLVCSKLFVSFIHFHIEASLGRFVQQTFIFETDPLFVHFLQKAVGEKGQVSFDLHPINQFHNYVTLTSVYRQTYSLRGK